MIASRIVYTSLSARARPTSFSSLTSPFPSSAPSAARIPLVGPGYRDASRYTRRRLHSSSVSRAEGEVKADRVVQAKDDKASFKDPLTRYDYLVSEGILHEDEHQKSIIQKLQRLWTDLQTYDPGPLPSGTGVLTPSFFGKFFSRTPSVPSPTMPLDKVPKGLYLHGSVGTGKTMLMDLFYSTLPPRFRPGKYGSTRIHFHSFMLEVLHRQHEVGARHAKLGLDKADATPEVARSLAAEGRVLCFDEFQVTDIVTAMILRQLLERLMGFGVVCVMTSNRHPDELYKNGIQRGSFIPAIELIKERFEIVDLDSETGRVLVPKCSLLSDPPLRKLDYRKLPRALSNVYYHPLDTATHTEMSKLFKAFAPDPVSDRKVSLAWGREMVVPESYEDVARLTFGDLCNRPLSAPDYLEISAHFGTVFVEGVPRMGVGERDQARRFITFIDACYENKTKLFMSSQVPIYQVFSDDRGKAASDDEHMRSVMDDLGLSADEVGTSSLFSGEEELFAFARCVSRLSQMGTKEWSEQSGIHRPPPYHPYQETTETE